MVMTRAPLSRTLLVAPDSKQPGQYYLMARNDCWGDPDDDYRVNPEKWHRAGTLDEYGKLEGLAVYLACFRDSLQACEPLKPGFRYKIWLEPAPQQPPALEVFDEVVCM